MSGDFRAGAASVSLEPPLGLPMVGFVRRHQTASWSVGDLEVTAAVFERGEDRAVVCGIDSLGIQAPEIDRLRERVARVAGADPAAVLLNFNHTHCAPPGSIGLASLGGAMDRRPNLAVATYIEEVAARTVSAVRLASSRLEDARVQWAVGHCDEAVNRRERTPDGRVILGWHEDGIVDRQVPVLEAARRDGSTIATVVTYGCHPVAVGPDVLAYCADFPGAMRRAVRGWTGGECVFVQGAGGNVLPRTAFLVDLSAAERVGRRLALAALAATDKRPGWPRAYECHDDGSVTPFHVYRPRASRVDTPGLAAAELRTSFPLQTPPSQAEVREERQRVEQAIAQAIEAGADAGRLNVLRYDQLWAQRTLASLEEGKVADVVEGPVHALRIGDGVFVTGPGEVFSEIGLAVRERSPATVTAYAGYTNGLISYFPTADEYPLGGYEPGHGNRTYGLPSQVAPECARILVETGLDAVESVFPEAAAARDDNLLASGRPPRIPPAMTVARPGPDRISDGSREPRASHPAGHRQPIQT